MKLRKPVALTAAATLTALGALTATAPASEATTLPYLPGGVSQSGDNYVFWFQVDRYMPRTAKQAATVNRAVKDGMLDYREGRALWGASHWQFVRVTVNAKWLDSLTEEQEFNYLTDAINKRTNNKVGDVSRSSYYIEDMTNTKIKAGQAVTVAWLLGDEAGPSIQTAWGMDKNSPQLMYARSNVSKR